LISLQQRLLQLPRNQRGALWMLGSALCFTFMTSLVKYLGKDYPAVLQTFYRQVASFLVIVPLILKSRTPVFRTSRPGLVVLRGIAGFLGMSLSFYSYQRMPLADANALSFTRTLWVVLLATLLLREPLGLKRSVATLVGFAGVMLILKPSAQSELGRPAAAALISALLLAMTVTGMKAMTRDHSTTTLIAYSSLLGMVFSLPAALWVWHWPSPSDLLLLTLMGVLGTATQSCYIKGMSAGEATVMASMDYTRLLFALAAGWLFFGTLPTTLTLLGALIIIAATLFITVFDSSAATSR
jgi:drug/metabolite transporter (DMT)-like permease